MRRRPLRPVMTRKMRELNEMTGGRLPVDKLREAADASGYVNGELVLYVDAVHILIDYSPLDPVAKELRRAQFETVAEAIRRKHQKETE